MRLGRGVALLAALHSVRSLQPARMRAGNSWQSDASHGNLEASLQRQYDAGRGVFMLSDAAAQNPPKNGSPAGGRVRQRLIQIPTFFVRTIRHPLWAWARIEAYFQRRRDTANHGAWTPPQALSVKETFRAIAPQVEVDRLIDSAPTVNSPTSTGMFGRQDGSTELVKFLYTYCKVTRPDLVAETGVAHGFSTAAILHALHENRKGALISIDLPQLSPRAVENIGKSVPDNVRDRWTLHLGPANRMIRPVLSQQEKVDLFVQDAAHSVDGQLAEYRAAWPFLKEGGILVSDDVTPAFDLFAAEVGRQAIYLEQPAKATPIGIIKR